MNSASDEIIPIDIEDIGKWLGEYTEEECPECGGKLLSCAAGDKWCGSAWCAWANTQEMIDFQLGLMGKQE